MVRMTESGRSCALLQLPAGAAEAVAIRPTGDAASAAHSAPGAPTVADLAARLEVLETENRLKDETIAAIMAGANGAGVPPSAVRLPSAVPEQGSGALLVAGHACMHACMKPTGHSSVLYGMQRRTLGSLFGSPCLAARHAHLVPVKDR
jgi:hypothetical protein